MLLANMERTGESIHPWQLKTDYHFFKKPFLFFRIFHSVSFFITAEFPFIAYYTINTTQTDPSTFYSGVRCASLSKFEPKNTRYTAAHTLDLYSEVASICRPPLMLAPAEQTNVKKTPTTGYIISVYKVSI